MRTNNRAYAAAGIHGIDTFWVRCLGSFVHPITRSEWGSISLDKPEYPGGVSCRRSVPVNMASQRWSRLRCPATGAALKFRRINLHDQCLSFIDDARLNPIFIEWLHGIQEAREL